MDRATRDRHQRHARVFKALDELKAQIRADAQQAREYLGV